MRVPRTFVFVDLSGFTNYTAAFGDDAAGRLLGTFRAIVREVASDRGVRIAKWLGDGCMVVAVEQQNAVAFTLDLRARSGDVCSPLTLRAGIATGYALLFEGDDYIGSAVNMASRLCDVAGHHQVLIAAMSIERLPEGVSRQPHRWRRARWLPRRDRGARAHRRPRAVREHRHRRALDPQPLHLRFAGARPRALTVVLLSKGCGDEPFDGSDPCSQYLRRMMYRSGTSFSADAHRGPPCAGMPTP